MKFMRALSSVSYLEMGAVLLAAVYLFFPVEVPPFVASWVNTSLGLAVVAGAAFAAVFYAKPAVAMISVVFAYELLRRCSHTGAPLNTPAVDAAPTQTQKDAIMVEMNPAVPDTLEEAVISRMAPLGGNDPATFIETSYKPIADKMVSGASALSAANAPGAFALTDADAMRA